MCKVSDFYFTDFESRLVAPLTDVKKLLTLFKILPSQRFFFRLIVSGEF